MHTFQLAAEDYGVQNDGAYAAAAATVAGLLPSAGANFKNPFTGTTTNNYEDRSSVAAAPSATSGLTSYADSATTNYNIKGYGKAAALSLVLTAGQ
jgi:hypothetical protein